jgi:hypothetical protein
LDPSLLVHKKNKTQHTASYSSIRAKRSSPKTFPHLITLPSNNLTFP